MVSHHRDTLDGGIMPKVTANICKNRHGMFYFRLVIPTRFRTHFPRNKREIRRSLKTDSQTLAIKRARFMRVRIDMLFEEIEVMSKSKNIKTGLITDFDAFGNEFTADFGDAEKEIAYAERRIEKSFEQKLKLDSLQATRNNQPSTPKISELAKAYIDIKQKNSKLKEKTLKEYKAAYDNFIYIVGDIEISEASPDVMNQYYNELRCIPSNRNTHPLYKGKTHSEIKLFDIPVDKRITLNTANNCLGRMYSLFKYAHKVIRIIDFNPAESIIREKEETHRKNKREVFSDTELKIIFESSHFTNNEWRKGQGRKEPYRFWLPLIGLLTGARQAEICQLNTSDIIEIDGVWVFNITDEYDKTTGEKIKSVKNQNSIRRIPIHQTLIDIGILKYVSSIKTKQLFPELNSKNDGIGAAQKWANYFLKKCGVHTAYTKTFHSLRHTFITKTISSGIAPIHVGAITGHLSKDDFGAVAEIANTYFKGFEPQVLKSEVISKLSFDINFDQIKWG